MNHPLPPAMERAVAALRERPIAATEKGFAALGDRGVSAAGLAAERPPLHEAGFTYPLMTLRRTALDHNIAGMAAYCAAAGVELAPHGKTAMAPQLAAAQLAAGAWGITAASVDQLRVYRAYGVPRVLIANEVVDPAGVAWLARELAADPAFEAYCYVDSAAGVEILDAVLTDVSGTTPDIRPLPVLVDFGHAGGRTGVRTADEARAVAAAVDAADTLRLAGVAGYEGSVGHDTEPATLAAVTAYCAALRALAEELRRPGEWIVTAGGSSFFDIVVRELTAGWGDDRPTVVLRSGAYVTHDQGFYGHMSPAARHAAGALTLEPAFELWAQVLSRPEPGLALLGLGRRDVAFDQGLPVPLRTRRRGGEPGPVAGLTVTELNDQHAFLRLPADARLAVGDLLCLGISHPCTTFDKWRVIPVVDGDDRVVDAVHTFF